MSTRNDRDDQQPEASLLDSQITTTTLDRRSFLFRAAGAGAVAAGAVVTAACGADNCDDDQGVTDADAGASADPAFQGADSCDADE